jgi:glycosyltransferase involved in cell wall biosynthesis
MSNNAVKYVIISPVRDEEANLARTIEAVIGQSLQPSEWIIVDDGSTDRTAEIADSYARQHDWIRVCRRDNRGFRQAGGGVVDAFNDGYANLRANDWEFIVKLDGDLSFSPDYFQSCFRAFQEEKALGIAGGTIYNVINGQEHPGSVRPFMFAAPPRSTAVPAGAQSAVSGRRPAGIRWTRSRRRCLAGLHEHCPNCVSFIIGRPARTTELGARGSRTEGRITSAAITLSSWF